MSWTITSDLGAFEDAAGDFLRARPVEHTVVLTVSVDLRVRGLAAYGGAPPLFGWWSDDAGAVGGAFLQTPPHRPLLTTLTAEAAGSLAELWDTGRPLPGVTAEAGTATAFADAWRARTGVGARVHKRIRLYRLGEPVPPDPAPPGRARTAGPGDHDLLADWFGAFARETDEPSANPDGAVADRIGYGGLTLWETPAGRPVSLAGVTRAVVGTVRVAPVYTPPELRGRGYAGAATAAVVRAALDGGADEVLLFTDLANPTSNALYQRLGYVPVDDRVTLTFGRPPV